MLDGLRDAYPVVHIASHYVFDAADSGHSFLLLGDGKHLETSQIEDSANIFENQDLVTLSACDTARASANGKEVEAFSDVVQELGAKAVIAALWEVDDTGTQILMPEFYRLREAGPATSKAEALQLAQLEMLHGGVKDAAGRSKAHPYYWAPFILIGNWK
jgi:CHAT domain-containing protein